MTTRKEALELAMKHSTIGEQMDVTLARADRIYEYLNKERDEINKKPEIKIGDNTCIHWTNDKEDGNFHDFLQELFQIQLKHIK